MSDRPIETTPLLVALNIPGRYAQYHESLIGLIISLMLWLNYNSAGLYVKTRMDKLPGYARVQ